MTLFICTAGTSIAGGPMREGETAEAYRDRIDAKAQRDRLSAPSVSGFLIRNSAETNGLARAKLGTEDGVVFLTSETEDGRICGEKLVAVIANEFGCRARSVEITGLQVQDGRRFRTEGIRNLFGTLAALTRERSDADIQINATGGFKGTIPYLVIYGMFENLPISYVYEGSDTLITLPILPIEFDWRRLSRAAEAIFAVFDAIEMPTAEWRALLPDDYYARQADYDVLFELDGGNDRVGLSAIGYLLNSRLEAAAEATPVLLSPSAKAALGAAEANVRSHFDFMLARVRDPLQRSGYRHAERVRGSDLLIWKRYGPMGPRMAYWATGDGVCIAELFPAHDLYERWYAAPTRRADYPFGGFREHLTPRNLDYGAGLEQIRSSKLEEAERLRLLEDERDLLRRTLDQAEMRQRAEIAVAQRAARAEEKAAAQHAQRLMQSKLGKQLSERDAKIAEQSEEIAALRQDLARLDTVLNEARDRADGDLLADDGRPS